MEVLELGSDPRPKLLIVDDESSIRRHLQTLAESLGFEACTASDGVEGWEVFNAEQPDLVVLDIYMPRLNGLALMSKIKNAVQDCPVVLITGFLNYEQLIKAGQNKPDGCIIKPLNLKKTGDLLVRLALKSKEEVEGEPVG
jgi:YesN/AraC family two-component response regulator